MMRDADAGVTRLLELRDVVKTFPGVRALDRVRLQVRPGEVHALLGQNGAGKSTLIKIVAGAQRPDGGELLWHGAPITLLRPTDALRLGIATIYQELDLIGGLSVAENVYLGHELGRGGIADRAATRRAAEALLARIGAHGIPSDALVETLAPAQQQMVSIARALSHDARLIVMDEPSAVFDRGEVAALFAAVRELRRGGVAVVYISHRLDEIRAIADVVTVIKDGRTVAERLDAATPERELVRLMTGRTIEYPFPPRPAPPAEPGRETLRVEGLSRANAFSDVSFSVGAGEIVGIAGLVGSGRSELLETIYGAARPTAGRITFDGAPLRPGSTALAVVRGMGLAPEERKRQALFLDDAAYKNASVATLADFARAGVIDRRAELDAVTTVLKQLDVRPAEPRRAVRDFSGGNQQKVVIARWLLHDCKLLLLDEPTRGVDVGARAEIYGLVRALAARGVALIVVSSEVPEVLGLADRVLVMREGRIVHQAPADQLDEARVLDLVMASGTAA